MSDQNNDNIERRTFLKASVASVTLSGCTVAPSPLLTKLPEPNEIQKMARRSAPSTVGILRAQSYDENLFAILKEHLSQLNIGDFKNKTVVLKPNMVECPITAPITTRPEVLKAAIQLVDYLGAKKIIVAEGPGHMRDTEEILATTGIGKVCQEMGIPFVDLNLDDSIEVPIKHSFAGVDNFILPNTIVNADAVISLPKLKTHHWVGMTAAMKNLFGIVPGRKYGYPKNFLHWKGIFHCILDLNRLVPTRLSIVDAITAMEGDGPINGTARQMGLLIVGSDPAAVDATCARIIGFDIDELEYIRVAGQVIGNVALSEISIIGLPIAEVAVDFKRPSTYLRDSKLSENALNKQAQSGMS